MSGPVYHRLTPTLVLPLNTTIQPRKPSTLSVFDPEFGRVSQVRSSAVSGALGLPIHTGNREFQSHNEIDSVNGKWLSYKASRRGLRGKDGLTRYVTY